MLANLILRWIGPATVAIFMWARGPAASAQSTGGSILAPQPSAQVELYRNMEKRYPTGLVRRGPTVRPLPVSTHLIDPRYVSGEERGSVDDFMAQNHVAR